MSDFQRKLDNMAGRKAKAVMLSRQWPDNARSMHAEIAAALKSAGFSVWNEYATGDMGDYRKGRIDIFAEAYGGSVAIELDARKPRARSIAKLRLFDCYKLIGLRGVDRVVIPDGIDDVIGLRVAL